MNFEIFSGDSRFRSHKDKLCGSSVFWKKKEQPAKFLGIIDLTSHGSFIYSFFLKALSADFWF
ncbi:MAG: hypothetical protein OXJ52_08690 [Oligoflexia bacterium]|nr:hypothetical protein [Oligoflexia bacterium]